MKHETQALHLAKMMQNHTRYPMYELTLPLITVRSNKLKKLCVNDILLIGMNRLEFLLLDGDTICANTRFKPMGNTHEVEIVYLTEETIEQYDSKKYQTLKISFGKVQSKALDMGGTIDITHLGLDNVTLVQEGKTIAEASLINVDEEIAIQIMKVN